MLGWLVKRLSHAVLIGWAMSVIVFVAMTVIGDPVESLLRPEATEAERQRLIQALGLDQPLWHQYLTFLKRITEGDFGTSFVFNQPALDVVLQRLPATLELAFGATLISVVLGLPLGLFAGLKPQKFTSKALSAASIVGFSIPTFWLGLILIMVFSVYLQWLPSGGRGETVMVLGVNWSFLTLDGIKHFILPSVTLSLFNIAMIMRLVRSGVRETMPLEYVKFARAKGIKEGRIVFVHILKNIMMPVVTMVGLNFASVIAFSVVTETIFSWPGMGKLIIDSIYALDRPVIVVYLLIVVLIFVTINIAVDLIYLLLDPRVKLVSEG